MVVAGCPLKVGDEKSVVIPWVNTPLDFYCQLTENESKLSNITRQMTKYYTNNTVRLYTSTAIQERR